jgi:hypothetical protein
MLKELSNIVVRLSWVVLIVSIHLKKSLLLFRTKFMIFSIKNIMLKKRTLFPLSKVIDI